MKIKVKKAISILLAVLMIISVCPTTILADSNEEYSYKTVAEKDGVTYVELTSYKGTSKSISLPTEIDGNMVVGLNYNFGVISKTKPNKIIVPEGYDYIGGLRGLKDLDITLPSSVKIIKNSAFQNTTIKSINFPEGLEAIDFRAFQNTVFKETNITLPDSLKFIGEFSFEGANIKNIEIGSNAKIGDFDYTYGIGINEYDISDDTIRNPFCNSKIQSITVNPDNPYITEENGVLYSKDKSVLYSYVNKNPICSFEIPESVNTVVWYAFSGFTIDDLKINETMENINGHSFAEIKANEITFGENCRIKTIDKYAFNKSIINNIVIPASVEKIDEYAFSGSTIKSLSFENGSKCQTIKQNSFSQCNSLESIIIPSSISTIENQAFYDCAKLKTVTFEDNSSLTALSQVFFKCPMLITIDFGDNSSIEKIDKFYSFTSNSYLKTVDLSGCVNLTQIGSYTFKNCAALKEMDLSNTKISSVSSELFSGCSSLQKVKLPETAYEIQDSAFYNCCTLEDINTDNIFKVGANAFYNCNALSQIPTSSDLQYYNGLEYYETETNIFINSYVGKEKDIVIPDYINSKPVTKILDNAFKDITVYNIVFPQFLESIGNQAFYQSHLRSISKLPESLKYIGEKAFFANNYLSGTLEIPENVRSVSKSAFWGCSFTELILHENLNTINEYAFYLNNFDTLVIPDSVTSIGNKAFYCETLKSVTFGNGTENIEKIIASNFLTVYDDYSEVREPDYEIFVEEFIVSPKCEKYTTQDGVLYNKDMSELIYFPQGKECSSFKISDSVKEIKAEAFYCTQNLKEIIIPNSVKSIGENAFKYSLKLESVLFKSGLIIDSLDSTFLYCSALKNVHFENDVNISMLISTFEETGIEEIDLNCNAKYLFETFCNCTKLKSINLHDGIETIEQSCFRQNAIEKIVIPKTVTTLGDFVFAYCSNLYYINLSNVKNLQHGTFKSCSSLESIDLTGIIHYEKNGSAPTFADCQNLKKFYFTAEEKEAYIAENEFEGNETIETVVIGNSVNEIQDRAFADCTNLQTALIADEVENISDTAFENCDNLTIVCLYNSPVMHYAQKNNIPYETFVISPIPDQEYTGKAITPKLDVKQAGKAMTLDKDYSASYKNNINIGTANVTVVGLGDYRIFATTSNFKIVKKRAEEDTTKPATEPTKPTTKLTTKPSAKPTTTTSPAPTAKPATTTQSDTAKKSAEKAPSGAKKVNGVWVNSKQKKTSVRKLKKDKKSFKVTWKKVSGVTGYQIQYSTSKNFTKKTAKTVTVNSSKNTSKTIKNLKSKKKYYVKVRTYKNVKFNGKTVKVYSSWSKVKSVKTK